MARFARLRGLDRHFNARELAAFLLITGRVGLLLREAGYDPASIYFCPWATSEVLEKLNDKSGISAAQFERFYVDAYRFVRSKFSFALQRVDKKLFSPEGLTSVGTRMIYCQQIFRELYDNSKELPYGKLQELLLCTKFAQECCPLDFKKHLSVKGKINTSGGLTFRAPQSDDLLYFKLIRDDEVLTRSLDMAYAIKGHANVLKQMYPDGYCPFPIFSFKLSQYGKKAVLRYFKEQEEKTIHWSYNAPYTEIVNHLPALGWQYKTTHLASSRIQFIKIVQDETQKAITNFFNAYKQHCIDNLRINLNGIELPTEVKRLLFDKVSANCNVVGLTYVSKVFKALRDHMDDLEGQAATFLTSEESDLRSAGLSIQSLLKAIQQMQDDDQEETGEVDFSKEQVPNA